MDDWADIAAARRQQRSKRRRGGRARTLVATSAALVTAGCGGATVLGSSLSDLSLAVPAGAAQTSLTVGVVAGLEGVLDVEPGRDIEGVTRPAQLSVARPQPRPKPTGTPGVDSRVPYDIDWVEAHRRAVEQHAAAEWMEAHRGERDAEWQRRRGLLCDDGTPEDLSHLCK